MVKCLWCIKIDVVHFFFFWGGVCFVVIVVFLFFVFVFVFIFLKKEGEGIRGLTFKTTNYVCGLEGD